METRTQFDQLMAHLEHMSQDVAQLKTLTPRMYPDPDWCSQRIAAIETAISELIRAARLR